ncbi:MAG: hypothetical protein KDM63_10195, partial [Verrucomicrobiae bacterium]|nr:hypothetical protein [Verrucomicrobiae bacterium]
MILNKKPHFSGTRKPSNPQSSQTTPPSIFICQMQMPSTPNPEEPVFSAALSTLWNSVCSDLTKQIGEAEFDRWFSTVNLVRLEPDALWISA